jgi:coenzyme F420 hydrogenase subunit beta
MKINSLYDVVKADLCSGCGLCGSIAGQDKISIEINEAGYFRPRINHLDNESWQVIQKVCPGVQISREKKRKINQEEMLWGPIQSIWAGFATEKNIRWFASSGGALSALLIYLIEANDIDCIVQIGTCDDPLTPTVCLSNKRQQILRNVGSRYAPSSPLSNLLYLLKKDKKRFAFVGKPCDVAALKAYANLYPIIQQRIIVMLSFFCAGVPSLFATYDLLQALGVEKCNVETIRYRGCGWPGRASVKTLDGKEYSMSYDESWGNILGKRLQLRCKICPDSVGELADISFGDAWHIKNGRPSFDESPGRTLILVRSERGQKFFNAACDSGFLEVETFPIDQLAIIQPYQINRKMSLLPRLLALRLSGCPTPRFEGFHLVRMAYKAGITSFVWQFLGMLFRLLQKKVLNQIDSHKSEN